MKVGVIEFPGSSGVFDAESGISEVFGHEVKTIWHQEEFIKGIDALIIPGGSAFGDYLRPGALTKASPIVHAINRFANDGKPVLGLGNGFQILCELDILPGALLTNLNSEFLSVETFMIPDDRSSLWTKHLEEDEIFRLPLSCYYGRYFVDPRTLRDMEENERIAFRYSDFEGEVHMDRTFNGSIKNIAGVLNRHKNVLGLMAHPERALGGTFGGEDGKRFLEGVFGSLGV